MKNFKHKTSIQVRFRDTDMMGHVNNAAYATYCEFARLKYFQEVVSKKEWSTQESLILARIEIDFRVPLFYGDDIFVYTKCSRMGNKSFELEYNIVREKMGHVEQTVAEAKTVIVCYDYKLQTTVAVAEDYKKRIADYENSTTP